MTGKRGFTLLEMLVASTIMAVAIVGLLSAIGGATRNAARLRDYDRAAQLARLRMNDLLADETLRSGAEASGTFEAALTGGLPIQWQARMSTVEMPPSVATGQPCLQRIELQIWWMAGDRKKTFTLDSYRTHILTQADL
ncbi:MAG TPA: prepilin-type N-terminal cleavage/methylation domain-containing protein [Bryobacteraceae bacterium]|nr:prepilin-type N-terminal cleavage/methylation domain-containing protein [Bryobacteraceae bacterium]